MNKFKLGQRVKLVNFGVPYEDCNDITGIISSVSPYSYYYVFLDEKFVIKKRLSFYDIVVREYNLDSINGNLIVNE